MSEPTDREIELMTQLVACLKKERDRGIFTDIGIALSAFARMEEAIVIIASNLLRANPRKTGLVMYSIINFQTWLSIVEQLFAEDDVFGSLAPKWNKISGKIRSLKDDRDRLAHHSAIGDEQEDDRVLSRSKWDVRSKSLAQKPLAAGEIQQTITKINDRIVELSSLIDSMTEILKSSRGKSP